VDITFVNLNMLFVRYTDAYEREKHLPLGLLYLTSVLERAGVEVDFRDYQMCEVDDPFDLDAFVDFVSDPAPIIAEGVKQCHAFTPRDTASNHV
jgi:hypothetical protein